MKGRDPNPVPPSPSRGGFTNFSHQRLSQTCWPGFHRPPMLSMVFPGYARSEWCPFQPGPGCRFATHRPRRGSRLCRLHSTAAAVFNSHKSRVIPSCGAILSQPKPRAWRCLVTSGPPDCELTWPISRSSRWRRQCASDDPYLHAAYRDVNTICIAHDGFGRFCRKIRECAKDVSAL